MNINNNKTWQILKKDKSLFQRYFVKEFLIKACRKFFEDRDYHELESPILAPALPQEAYLDVLETNIQTKSGSKTVYIIPTTERYNKIILAAGLGNHFVITKVIRGTEEITTNHSPEFTMLEWYHLNGNYMDLINDFIQLIRFSHRFVYDQLYKEKQKKLFPINVTAKYQPIIQFHGYHIDISIDPYIISIPDYLKEIINVDLEIIQSDINFRNFMLRRGYVVTEEYSWQEMFEMLFATEIEPTLPKDRIVCVVDYPKQVCVLTKQKSTNPLVCERVEIYLAGLELANGYTELLDWQIQKENFDIQLKLREKIGLKKINYDYELLQALKEGLPNVAGIGMGIDRLAMIYANANSISEINYFPISEWF
ncbi:MAG: hypothetical protein NZZ41_07050 [Candidatus Dojkabacteria bacterium]|nr:hypothetical protein [Candidatus Dojkabacteria bacterium]